MFALTGAAAAELQSKRARRSARLARFARLVPPPLPPPPRSDSKVRRIARKHMSVNSHFSLFWDLENRTGQVLETIVGFGILECFECSMLVWLKTI